MDHDERGSYSPTDSEEDVKRLLDDSGQNSKKAPFPLRIVAWLSLIAVFFALGYGGTSIVLKYLDKKGVTSERTVVADPQGAEELLATEDDKGAAGIARERVRLYLLHGKELRGRTLEFVPGLPEDNIRKTLNELFRRLKSEGVLDDEVQVLHFFRTGDLSYIDLNDSFQRSLDNLPSGQAVMLLTGVVRTMTENFAPITKVRFLINGREVTERGAVDLSVAWQLAPRS